MGYPGGKFHCYQQLINLIPPHRVYIETHLGGGAVLRKKHPADVSFGLDRDPAVIRGYTGKFASNFHFVVSPAERWLLGYKFVGDEFIYADPPYLRCTRRAIRSPYRYDYTDEEHIHLIAILTKLPCRIMISGYRNRLYQDLLSEWHAHDFEVGSRSGRRVETVWLNYSPGALHDTRYLGRSFRERQAIKRRRERWVRRFRNEPWPVQQALLADMTRAFSERFCLEGAVLHPNASGPTRRQPRIFSESNVTNISLHAN